MASTPRFELVVDGKRYSGWKSIELVRSMEYAADEVVVDGTHRWRDAGNMPMRAGLPMEVFLDNELLSTGYIDAVGFDYDASSSRMNIRGRSKLADLVDCTLIAVDGKSEFKNQTLAQLANLVCKPFGIEVIDNANASKPFGKATLTEYEPVWYWLDELARIRAVRLMGTPAGKLVITRTGKQRSTTHLVLGDNIRRGRVDYDLRSRFSEYRIAANQDGTELKSNAQIALVAGTAKDGVFGNKRFRPITVGNESSADAVDAATRADWEMRVHAGRSQLLTYTVGGWQQDSGEAWAPNLLVPVRDEFAGIDDEQLIVTARLVLDESGPFTELTLMPPAAMDLIPLAEPDADNAFGVVQ